MLLDRMPIKPCWQWTCRQRSALLIGGWLCLLAGSPMISRLQHVRQHTAVSRITSPLDLSQTSRQTTVNRVHCERFRTLRMLAYMTHQDHTVALLASDSQHMWQVHVDDRIKSLHARVIAITPQRTMLQSFDATATDPPCCIAYGVVAHAI